MLNSGSLIHSVRRAGLLFRTILGDQDFFRLDDPGIRTAQPQRIYAAPAPKELRVLMYHKIDAGNKKDYLTVPAGMLEDQFRYFLREGYTPIFLSQLVNFQLHKSPLPSKPLLISFDDGYRDNFEVMYPLLKKYGMKANIFLVPELIGKKETIPGSEEAEFMHLDDIRSMDPRYVEFGLHSYDHHSFGEMNIEDFDNDLKKTMRYLHSQNIPFQPCLAFPFGAYPRKDRMKQEAFFRTLALNNVLLAFRIGNRVNPLPLKTPLVIQRLDIRGDMPMSAFIRRFKKGKSIF